jgi:hypothetical protein
VFNVLHFYRFSSESFINIVSGQQLPPFSIVLLDYYDQKIISNSDYEITLLISDLACTIQGGTQKDVVNGSAVFDDITLSCPPGQTKITFFIPSNNLAKLIFG